MIVTTALSPGDREVGGEMCWRRHSCVNLKEQGVRGPGAHQMPSWMPDGTEFTGEDVFHACGHQQNEEGTGAVWRIQKTWFKASVTWANTSLNLRFSICRMGLPI